MAVKPLLIRGLDCVCCMCVICKGFAGSSRHAFFTLVRYFFRVFIKKVCLYFTFTRTDNLLFLLLFALFSLFIYRIIPSIRIYSLYYPYIILSYMVQFLMHTKTDKQNAIKSTIKNKGLNYV